MSNYLNQGLWLNYTFESFAYILPIKAYHIVWSKISSFNIPLGLSGFFQIHL